MANPTFTYQSDFARKFVAEGKAEGKAEGILSVLAHRRLDVPDDAKARITACTDIDKLNTWMDRAFTVDTAADIFR